MRWLLAFHLIFVVAWFAGLFYLPRLFVYHASTQDQIGRDRFKVMEYKLYYYITWPAGVLATAFGIAVFTFNWQALLNAHWMQAKLALVIPLWWFHLYNGRLLRDFSLDQNRFSEKFYRFFNEIPTILLISIIILAVVHPI